MSEEEEIFFSRFSDFPPEVRLLIWECALPEPCIVHISNHATDDLDRTEEFYAPLRSRQPESPLRSVCRDSRRVFKREYMHLDRITNFEHERPVFFDPKVDTLYLDVTCNILYHPTMNRQKNAATRSTDEERAPDNTTTTDSTDTLSEIPQLSHFSFLASQEILKSIQHLAIEYKSWKRFCFEHKITLISDFFPCFPALETFSFVFGDPWVCDEGEEFKYPLEMEDIEEGTRAWLYAETVLTAESAAFQKIRKEHPTFKAPRFDIKILKKGKKESMGAFSSTGMKF